MRKQIINEIQRLARESGGKAPSMVAFARATGIKQSEWYGKIWARWSEAIAEAGLTPNEPNKRLSSELVIQKYAEVCRHYRRVPSGAEIRIYARNTPDFVSYNTFATHFRDKNGMIAALRDWAIRTQDLEIIGLLPATENDDEKPADWQVGYVYLLKSGSFFKIGRSNEIEKRVKQISVAMPEKVELVHAIRTDDPVGIEDYWHKRFAPKRANGEWFELTQADVRIFCRRKFQ